jgi:SAM-dependent methyltransferase
MNKAHEMCGSDEWRKAMREVILPWALNGTDLGDEVLEVGPGYGATTDVLSHAVPRLTSVEIDRELAAMLADRFADVPSVEIVNADATSLSYDDNRFSGAACFTMLHHVPTSELHDRDTYNPVDPATLCDRLSAAGFTDVDVRTNDYGWAVIARIASWLKAGAGTPYRHEPPVRCPAGR